MIKKIIILIITAYSITVFSAQNEIELSRCSISEISPSDFLLSYSVKNTFDADSYSNLEVVLPFEKYIFQGSADNGIINEKDFLFSQMDVDLNNDSDINDSFRIKISKNRLTIDNKKISPITKTTSDYNVLTPLNEAGNYNTTKLTEKGKPFILRYISSLKPEIIVGLNTETDIEFRKFSNNLLFIEVIHTDKNISEKILIDNRKPFTGITNETDLTGGENAYRSAAVKNIIVNSSAAAAGEIEIKEVRKPFTVRITYYFAISENLILMNQKIVKVN